MFDNRRYQAVIARAGRGRHTLAGRRVLEVNLLIIGTLIFIGVGIASLQSDADTTVTLKPVTQKNVRLPDGTIIGPETLRRSRNFAAADLLRRGGVMMRTAVLEVALPNQILTRSTAAVAAQSMVETAARPPRDADDSGETWVRAPHPLAVPVPVGSGRPTHRVVRTSFGMIAIGAPADDPPAPLVRLDTTTGASPFWYVLGALLLVTFLSGFRNSRKVHSK